MATPSEKPLVIEPESDSDPEEFSDAITQQEPKDDNDGDEEFFDVDWNEHKSDSEEGNQDDGEFRSEASAEDLKVSYK